MLTMWRKRAKICDDVIISRRNDVGIDGIRVSRMGISSVVQSSTIYGDDGIAPQINAGC